MNQQFEANYILLSTWVLLAEVPHQLVGLTLPLILCEQSVKLV